MTTLHRNTRPKVLFASVLAALLLIGCGGGGGGGGSASIGSATSTTGSGSTPISNSTLQISLVNQQGQASNRFKVGEEGVLSVRLQDSFGRPLNNQIITLDLSNPALGTLDAASLLTDGNGQASTRFVASSSQAGAATFTASTKSQSSSSYAFAVENLILNLNNIRPTLATINSGGTVGVSIDISDAQGNAIELPIDVTFSSTCSLANKATLDGLNQSTVKSTTQTVNGIRKTTAVSTYTDKGCGTSDKITATARIGTQSRSISTNPDLQISAAINNPSNLEYVSATPANIKLRSLGGSISSDVLFIVKDQYGNPLQNQTVNFALNSAQGGTTLSPTSATTDARGQVSTKVFSGNVSTVVRVTATINNNGNTIQTQSGDLTISTGIPHYNGLSLAASTLNPEFLSRDGETINLVVYSSDRFGNPVPDNTPISFRTENGIGNVTPSCLTKNGACQVTLTSSGNRGALVEAGKQTIMAFTDGEESFSDSNGNGVWDSGEPFTDLPEIFLTATNRDYKNSSPQSFNTADNQNYREEFVDYNSNGQWDNKDGQYNGSLRSTAVSPSVSKSLTIGRNIQIIWAGSTFEGTITTSACQRNTASITVDPVDSNGNTLPAGTSITFTAGTGLQTSGTSSFILPSQSSTMTYSASFATAANSCPIGSGASVEVNVKTPKGVSVISRVVL